MKKSLKKLVLAKETVRKLSAVDLAKAAGGTSAGTHLTGDSCRICVDQPLTYGC
jgi:hypothetical protein